MIYLVSELPFFPIAFENRKAITFPLEFCAETMAQSVLLHSAENHSILIVFFDKQFFGNLDSRGEPLTKGSAR